MVVEHHSRLTSCWFCFVLLLFVFWVFLFWFGFCLFFISMNLIWEPGVPILPPAPRHNEDTSLWNPTLPTLSSYSWDAYLSLVSYVIF